MQKKVPLTQEQINKLLNELEKFPDNSWHDVAAMVATTGLRMREVARLRWSDVDLKSNQLTVAGRRPRTIPIPAEIQALLVKRHAANPASPMVFERRYKSLVDCVNRALKCACLRCAFPPPRLASCVCGMQAIS